MATISETHFENRERIQPNDTNNYGAAHGGNIMRWMDEVGALCAMRHAGETCVTAHEKTITVFKCPVPQGDTCVITAYAYATGRTSIRVRLQAFHKDPRTGDREQTTDSYFVFVAIDDGNPTPVPDLTAETERCERLREAALAGEASE